MVFSNILIKNETILMEFGVSNIEKIEKNKPEKLKK